jgi:glycosyltransferase involved in cell wall biosynthesis
MAARSQVTSARQVPTRHSAFIFRGKSVLLQASRLLREIVSGSRPRKYPTGSVLKGLPEAAVSRTPLWTETDPAERFLVAGKIHNLRAAARRLNGVELPAGAVFSFWRQVGRASRFRGYVAGRELREGCIIPNIGGGLCQLSNALYDAALKCGLDIVERHAHTRVVAGSLAEQGRDATVFWNYVDLRFRAPQQLRIEVELDTKDLIVRFRSEWATSAVSTPAKYRPVHEPEPGSCATCEVGDCHRVIPKTETEFGRIAFLVDEYSPEFDGFIQEERKAGDRLFVPLDGRRFRRANYAWSTAGFGDVRQSLFVTAQRSFASRRLAAQGRARQLNLLAMQERLARDVARRLRYEDTHLIVHQGLLPYLWRDGHLGGRTFDVLLSALPMSEIQKQLDAAASLYPESTTLADFRADPDLLAAENAVLERARRIITPHSFAAKLFPGRAQRLDWAVPAPDVRRGPAHGKPVIVFPASTVGRKGCYELREALRDMDVSLMLQGPVIESAGFWKGFNIVPRTPRWLDLAAAVVLPAFVEHRPRRLLMAAAAGIPAIASAQCGLEGVKGVTTLEKFDAETLRSAIEHALSA